VIAAMRTMSEITGLTGLAAGMSEWSE
jgi:hypothetical protein